MSGRNLRLTSIRKITLYFVRLFVEKVKLKFTKKTGTRKGFFILLLYFRFSHIYRVLSINDRLNEFGNHATIEVQIKVAKPR